MTEVVIRRAGDADRAAIVGLRREWTQEQGGDDADPAFDERLSAWLAREWSRRIIWLAEPSGRPVGMMNLAIFERMPRPGRPPSRWAYLGNVFVLAACRNQGIGTQLISAVLRYRPISKILLERTADLSGMDQQVRYERAAAQSGDSRPDHARVAAGHPANEAQRLLVILRLCRR